MHPNDFEKFIDGMTSEDQEHLESLLHKHKVRRDSTLPPRDFPKYSQLELVFYLLVFMFILLIAILVAGGVGYLLYWVALFTMDRIGMRELALNE